MTAKIITLTASDLPSKCINATARALLSNSLQNRNRRRKDGSELTVADTLRQSRFNQQDSHLHPRMLGVKLFGTMVHVDSWISQNTCAALDFIKQYEDDNRVSVQVELRKMYTAYGHEAFDTLMTDAFLYALACTLDEIYKPAIAAA